MLNQISPLPLRDPSLFRGGETHALGGNFFQPTVLTDVPREAEMANDTQFGLVAYFYSRDVGRIFRVAEALEYEIIGSDEGIVSTEVAPFGGMKSCGLGREGSRHGIEDYLEVRYLALGGIGI